MNIAYYEYLVGICGNHSQALHNISSNRLWDVAISIDYRMHIIICAHLPALGTCEVGMISPEPVLLVN